MPRIVITGASFNGYHFTCGPKRGNGGPMVIAEFTAPWTEKNRKAGGWEELPETISGNVTLLPSSLAASHFEFIPGKGLEKHAISIDSTEATNFHCFVPTKEGESRELRFKLKTAVDKSSRTLDTLGRTIGTASGKLTISYAESAKDDPDQASLLSEEQRAANSKNAD